jgi:iron complex transport system permease protein
MTTAAANSERRLLGLLTATLAIAVAASLATGNSSIGLPGDAATRWLILTEIRLPRTLLGLLVGGGLALSGAALQGYLRNPLAEPGLIGVSGGAALGAVLAIHLGAAGAFALALPLAGLTGAAAAALCVLALAGTSAGPVALILAGVAVSSFAAALVSLALNLSANPFAAAESIFWMMGSLADRSTAQLALAGPFIGLGSVLLLRVGRALDALALGEDSAASLGVDLDRTRTLVILGVALIVGASTAVTGIIGFVGLIVPHLLRRHVAHQPSRLLAASALGGATLLLLADVALRLVTPWIDVRIGVLTAVLGAPFFLWLVIAMRREIAP